MGPESHLKVILLHGTIDAMLEPKCMCGITTNDIFLSLGQFTKSFSLAQVLCTNLGEFQKCHKTLSCH